jgi:hypothetical protein
MDGPCHAESRQVKAVQRRVNAGRHGLLDNLDAAPCIVHQVFGYKRLAQCLDAAFLDDPLAGIALKGLNGR